MNNKFIYSYFKFYMIVTKLGCSLSELPIQFLHNASSLMHYLIYILFSLPLSHQISLQFASPNSLLGIPPRGYHLVNNQGFVSTVVSRGHQCSILHFADVVFGQRVSTTILLTILKQHKDPSGAQLGKEYLYYESFLYD